MLSLSACIRGGTVTEGGQGYGIWSLSWLLFQLRLAQQKLGLKAGNELWMSLMHSLFLVWDKEITRGTEGIKKEGRWRMVLRCIYHLTGFLHWNLGMVCGWGNCCLALPCPEPPLWHRIELRCKIYAGRSVYTKEGRKERAGDKQK